MKTNNQVEVIVFKKEGKEFLFLLLKRNPEKGGFWQPITGNVRKEESFENAALRELREETGIVEVEELVDTDFAFEFFDDERQQFEKVFGVKVKPVVEIKLSSEHTEYKWVTAIEALHTFLKYPGNREGLKRLTEKLSIKEGFNES